METDNQAVAESVPVEAVSSEVPTVADSEPTQPQPPAEPAVVETEEQRLWRAVTQDPTDFDSWVALAKEVQQQVRYRVRPPPHL